MHLAVALLKQDPNNARKHDKKNLDAIKGSLKAFGQQKPFVVNKDHVILAGNGTYEAAVKLGWTELWVHITELPDMDQRAYALADNRSAELAVWDEAILNEALKYLTEANFDITDIGFDLAKDLAANADIGSMVEKFGVPPFSVLDTRQNYWKERRNQWLQLGIKSELGRDAKVFSNNKLKDGTMLSEQTEVSVFDPMLCELVYKWFCPNKGSVLDPFAGGSVRGIVAAKLGLQYLGVDLRKEQVEENIKQAKAVVPGLEPVWVCGDSRKYLLNLSGKFDLLFSCPPYGDLSNMEYEEFKLAYFDIIVHGVARLQDNAFAVFVVGDFRDKKGNYRNFVSHTIEGFITAGMQLYNEAILVNSVGSLPLRAGRAFSSSRKLGKLHQNVLVFVKGDAKKATQKCGEIKVEDWIDFCSVSTES